jgi:hypothetical protein
MSSRKQINVIVGWIEKLGGFYNGQRLRPRAQQFNYPVITIYWQDAIWFDPDRFPEHFKRRLAMKYGEIDWQLKTIEYE